MALEVVEQLILEVLTPNQKEDKDNLRQIREYQNDIREDISIMKADIEQVKKHLELLTGEKEPDL